MESEIDDRFPDDENEEKEERRIESVYCRSAEDDGDV